MKGVIAAGDQHTAAAGAAILRRGGNAVDAAVAAAFASFIAEIGFVHLGGSGLAQLYDPATGQATVYDFFSNMPGLGRTPPAQLDFHRVTVDFGGATQDFHIGRASVAVPGNIFGLCQLAADRGSLSLDVLLEPALSLARDGLPLPPFQAYACSLLEPIFRHSPSVRAVFEREGRLLRGGERLFVPDLAETLQEIAAHGPDALRGGRLGQALLDDQASRGGLITPDDLAQYEVMRQTPIELSYRGYEVRLPGPPSGGGALLAFALKLLSRFVLDFPPNSAPHLRLLCEVQAAAQRARLIWERERRQDPAQALATLLDEAVIGEYAAAIRIAIAKQQPSSAPPEPTGPGNTSHLSVLDETGLAVSLTTTAGESAGFIVPGTGMIPNNMGGEADLHPQGFHVRPAGQRIPTMMTPIIVT
ncbi:MAG: gamma-glutamyltransferase, partial [Anaerolineales bacterium]|nr:gamma-glutamyltransferase [Anaerolineales bacterium]